MKICSNLQICKVSTAYIGSIQACLSDKNLWQKIVLLLKGDNRPIA